MARSQPDSKHLASGQSLRLEKTLRSPVQARFVELIREARVTAGLTQVEAARLLGVPQNFISNVERGERRVDVVEFATLCRVYGIRPNAFFDRLTAASDPESEAETAS